MLKVISLLKKKEETSLEEFRRWATEEHPEIGKKLPGMRRYFMSVVLEDSPDLPYHAVSEFWFDDKEAMQAAFATPEGKAAAEDAIAHCAARTRLLTEETTLIA
ncbi:MAG TPA: EthD family reductase [Anaerolineae bacterium]|jgi:uncharacterized protein (TIGR02118 family)|nr:EthD family reductase [Anaerolineae bacterium]